MQSHRFGSGYRIGSGVLVGDTGKALDFGVEEFRVLVVLGLRTSCGISACAW